MSLSKVTTGDERGTASLSEVTQEESEGSHEFIRGNTDEWLNHEFIGKKTTNNNKVKTVN